MLSKVTGGRGELATLRRRLFSGGAWAFAGKVGHAGMLLVVNALLARLLSPQDLGAYFLIFSLMMLGAVVGSMGLNQVAVRYVAASMGMGQPGRARRVVVVLLGMGSLGTLMVALAYGTVGGAVASAVFRTPILASVAGLTAGWIAVTALQNLLAEIFRGFHDIRGASLFGGLLTTVVFATCLALVLGMRQEDSLPAVLLLAVVAGGANLALAGWALGRRTARMPAAPEHVEIGEVMGTAWPLLITSFTLLLLTQADLLVLGVLRPQEEVALYGAAVRLVSLIAMPLLIVNAVVPPLIAEMHARGRMSELENTLRAAATLAGIPAFLVLTSFVVAGGWILSLVYGGYYSGAATVLAILSLGHMANVFSGSCGLVLMLTGNQRSMMVITLLSSALIVAGAFGLGRYGPTSVAAVAASVMILQNVLMLIFARRKTGIWTHVSFSIPSLRKTLIG